MKTLFIFGAGASKQAGAPLMNDFLDRAFDLYRTKNGGINEVRDDFEKVFDAISQLRAVHSKAYIDLDNLEVVFGAIEMASLIGQLGARTKEEIQSLKKSFIIMIYKTLEQSIQFPVGADDRVMPVIPFSKFLQLLKKIEETSNSQDPHEFSFITFNYDLCLDHALMYKGYNCDYCLTGAPLKGIPLLKLHGSINWGLSNKNDIVPVYFSDLTYNVHGSSGKFKYNIGSNLHLKLVDGTPLSSPPVIVPPTWNKTSYHGELSNVWERASRELASANNIVIIGYSLPETDSFFRYLYALGTDNKTRLMNFILVNPDPNGDVEKRFRAMLGRGIESKIRIIRETFQTSIPEIERFLVGT